MFRRSCLTRKGTARSGYTTFFCYPRFFGEKPSALPAQGAFFQDVDIGDSEDADETEHAPEEGGVTGGDEVPEDDGPGVHEHDFDVENDKEHSHEVKLYTKTCLGVPHRKHPALVGGVFDHIFGTAFTQDDAEQQGDPGETGGDDELHQYG